MALQAVYQQFLASPNSASLSADASLYYITTATVYHGSTDIIKHLGSLRNQLKKNKEAVLSSIESASGLALEIDTALEFMTGGGPYLPRLDENFVTDRKVQVPVVRVLFFGRAFAVSHNLTRVDVAATCIMCFTKLTFFFLICPPPSLGTLCLL